ncbi:MAG: hypothetical protein KDD47_27730, partial [Acidobacteria bacterium]|nr:hypothetical protein [Acidobacteriota bacterium]
ALLGLLEKADRALAVGGVVCLAGIPCFWHALGGEILELVRRRNPSLPLAELEDQVRRRMTLRQELLLAPAFFTTFLAETSRWQALRILPGRGPEEAGYFDVLLRKAGSEEPEGPPTVWVDWRNGATSLRSLSRHLEERRPAALGLTGLRSPHWDGQRGWAHAFQSLRPDGDRRVCDLLAAVAEIRSEVGGSLEAILELARRQGYRERLSWGRSGSDGLLDLLLVREEPGGAVESPWLPLHTGGPSREKPQVHEPFSDRRRKELARRLREHLAMGIPTVQIPVRFDFVSELPYTRSTSAAGGCRPLSGATEELVGAVWREVLGLGRCNAEDRFFLLGGDSRSAIKAVLGLREAFGVEVPMRVIFEEATVAEVAARIDELLEARLDEILSETAPTLGSLPLGAGGVRLVPGVGARGVYRNRK